MKGPPATTGGGQPFTSRAVVVVALASALTSVMMLGRTLASTTDAHHTLTTEIEPGLRATADATGDLPTLNRTAELVRGIAAATVPMDPPVTSAVAKHADLAATVHDIREILSGPAPP